jgi:hypothetical protein
MTSHPMRLGYRIAGGLTSRRRLVDAGAAFAAYAACDPRAEVHHESYLSAFWFGADFRDHLGRTGSPKGYDGPCWAPFVWFDLDAADDPRRALDEARGLAGAVLDRYRTLDEDGLLSFFSGGKGCHVGLPAGLWGPEPSPDFHRVARRFAGHLAALARVTIDTGVYDKVRAFRAPNSRHPKTGLYKRRLAHGELMGLSLDGVRRLAGAPEPFALPAPPAACPQAAADWRDATAAVRREAEATGGRRAAVADGAPALNRQTLAFIRDGAGQGDRHRLLFSAAANLAEFGCPPALAHALLTEAGLDSGLPPADVRRQIVCGLNHAAKQRRGDGKG